MDLERGLLRITLTLVILTVIALLFVLLISVGEELSFRLLLILRSQFWAFLGFLLLCFLIWFFGRGFQEKCSPEPDSGQMSATKSHKTIIICSIIIFLYATLGGGYLIHYVYYSTHTGSYSGKVVNASTGEPVREAVVFYYWDSGGGFMRSGGRAFSCTTATNENGEYFIPNQDIPYGEGKLKPEQMLIYKNGYAAYELLRKYKEPPMGESFGYHHSKNQKYSKKNNIVKLYPWKEGKSHKKHVDWIDYVSKRKSELLEIELAEERKLAEQE